MATIWNGTISFGLVTVPVRLETAVRSNRLEFHRVNAGTGNRVRQRRVDEVTGEEVAWDQIDSVWDPGDRDPVQVDRDELDALDPEASEVLDIRDFVALDEIDPVYYDRAYQVLPRGEAAARAYRLLVEAMERSGRVAIATFVLRSRQNLAALRPRDGMLVLSTMHFAEEVLPVEEHDEVDMVRAVEVRERELAMAQDLIDQLTVPFDPQRYHDEHRERVLAFLEEAGQGGGGATERDRRPDADVIDLTAALERSLGGAKRTGGDTDGDRYTSMTRDELYALAQERDVDGRSSMDKAELVTALRNGDGDEVA